MAKPSRGWGVTRISSGVSSNSPSLTLCPDRTACTTAKESALCKAEGRPFDAEEFSHALVGRGKVTLPLPEDVAAFHRPGGYLERFAETEARLLQEHPAA